MTDFYADMAQVAKELLEEFGREVEYAPNGTVSIVADKPWRGVAPIATTTITAAIFDATAADKQLYPDVNFTKTAIVAAKDLGQTPRVEDVIEDDINYRVVSVKELKPGPTSLLYTLLLSAKSS